MSKVFEDVFVLIALLMLLLLIRVMLRIRKIKKTTILMREESE